MDRAKIRLEVNNSFMVVPLAIMVRRKNVNCAIAYEVYQYEPLMSWHKRLIDY